MARTQPRPLVIDARPNSPRGPFALDRVQGRMVLDHLLDLAEAATTPGDTVIVVVPTGNHRPFIAGVLETRASDRFLMTECAPVPNASVLRTDRLYDERILMRTLRRGDDPDAAVIWRLDRPHALAGAEDELKRRRTYQPLGRYWALAPARRLARALAPTVVRPNGVTLAASCLFLSASGVVAFAPVGLAARVIAALGLALALVLDTADGHLARLQGTASAFGRWLDAWLDEVGDMALHAAIACSAYTHTGAVAWLLIGMFYGMGKYVFVAGAMEPDAAEKNDGVSAPAPRAESWFVGAVRLVGHADVRWHLWIVLAACGRLDAALVGYAAYYPARALLGAARKAVRRA